MRTKLPKVLYHAMTGTLFRVGLLFLLSLDRQQVSGQADIEVVTAQARQFDCDRDRVIGLGNINRRGSPTHAPERLHELVMTQEPVE